MTDFTLAELARRYEVARSTVARAVERGREMHAADASVPAPPQPVNPGELQLRYPVALMDAWWPRRPGRGRPSRADTEAAR